MSTEFDLDDYGTIELVESALKRMQLVNGGTNIGEAVNYVTEKISDKNFGARASSPKVVVILTDGQDQNPNQSEIVAAAKRLQKTASVFVIGIGSRVFRLLFFFIYFLSVDISYILFY